MPSCVVPNCYNSSSKGHKMCYFPLKNLDKCATWVRNIGRENWVPTRHSAICQVHFATETWENRRTDGLLKLKNNAVPTLFSHIKNQTSTVTRQLPASVSISDTRMDVENSCDCDSSEAPEDIRNLLRQPTNEQSNDHSSCAKKINYLSKRYEKSERLRQRTARKLADAKLQIKQLKKQVSLLKKCPNAVEDLFNLDQIKRISGEYKKVPVWSDNTINKAMQLRFSCGSAGYLDLTKQFPLPSLRTLRRRLEIVKF